MNRRVSIHEFESVSESDLGKDFTNLENLILQNRGRGTEPVELLSLSVKRGIGKIATARNYVGIITFYDGVELEILPKIGSVYEDDADGISRKIFLRMLQTVFDLPFKEFDTATSNSEKMSIFEFFIGMFVRETENLFKNGLSSSYFEVSRNELFLKGRINFSENIRTNLVHKERFFVEYQTYGLDRPENRLIKTTLSHLFDVSRESGNRRKINSLLHEIEAVPFSTDVENDFSKVNIDRNMIGYQRIMRWCEIFLRNKSFTTFSGTNVLSSFLFPMDTLYEAYIAKTLERNLRDKVTVRLQNASGRLFDNSNRFRLRPDILFEADDRRLVVDTKWKILVSDKDISESDMYQMYVYSRKYDAKKTILLYPKSLMNEVSFQSSKDGVNIDICFVDMLEPEDSLRILGNRILKELCI